MLVRPQRRANGSTGIRAGTSGTTSRRGGGPPECPCAPNASARRIRCSSCTRRARPASPGRCCIPPRLSWDTVAMTHQYVFRLSRNGRHLLCAHAPKMFGLGWTGHSYSSPYGPGGPWRTGATTLMFRGLFRTIPPMSRFLGGPSTSNRVNNFLNRPDRDPAALMQARRRTGEKTSGHRLRLLGFAGEPSPITEAWGRVASRGPPADDRADRRYLVADRDRPAFSSPPRLPGPRDAPSSPVRRAAFPSAVVPQIRGRRAVDKEGAGPSGHPFCLGGLLAGHMRTVFGYHPAFFSSTPIARPIRASCSHRDGRPLRRGRYYWESPAGADDVINVAGHGAAPTRSKGPGAHLQVPREAGRGGLSPRTSKGPGHLRLVTLMAGVQPQAGGAPKKLVDWGAQ